LLRRKSAVYAHDPESGYRFSDKIMRTMTS